LFSLSLTMRTSNLLTDDQFTKLLQQGDRNAFTEIYNKYWKKLLAIAYNHTKNKTAAEEITQEVFISLWNRRESIQIKTLANYLATAAKFAIFKQIQRQRRQREIEASGYNYKPFSMDESAIDALFLQDYIDGIVNELPEKCRLVFKYSREAGLSIPEISREMNIAEKTVESHLTKALKVLRLKLRQSGLLVLAASLGVFR
jgi:RNA polymerase sigma-70 factor (family 1)